MTLLAGSLNGKVVLKINNIELKIFDKTCNQYFTEEVELPEIDIQEYLSERFNENNPHEEFIEYAVLSFYYETLAKGPKRTLLP